MSCSFPRSVPDLVNHQYGICRMATRVLDMINLQLNNGQLVNADKSNVDMSVIPTGLSSNPNYVFGEVKVVETKK